MEAILFIGIQATGKSSFYQKYFANTHIRINLDMLKTRHREKQLFECCLNMQQPFVLDNTNLSRQDRQRYIPTIQEYGVPLCGYYFASQLQGALERNAQRGTQAIPEKGVLGAYKRLELPSYDEGFTALYYVKLNKGEFRINEWDTKDGSVWR
jgi:predicted kinase